MENFKCANVRVSTPDGTMFVNIMEDDKGNPFQILINVGKSGSAVAAWSYGLGETLSMLLRDGKDLEDIITMLSNITSSGKARTINSRVSSGPEGLWLALIKYKKLKFKEFVGSLNEDELEGSSGRINRR